MAGSLVTGRAVVAARGLVGSRPLRGSAGTPVVTPPNDPTTPPLPNAPVIESITESALTETEVTLTIVVDQPCQCQVFYDTDSGTVTGDYALSTKAELSFTYSTHVQRPRNLASSTKYYYRVKVTNSADQTTLSAEGDFTTLGPAPGAVEYPPLDTLRYIATPAFAEPTYLQTKTDPTFGTQLIRVNPNAGQAHAYSTRACWSKDRKWMLLGQGSPKLLLNGTTFAVVDSSGVDPGGGFQWSHTDPDLGFAHGATVRVNGVITKNSKMRFYGVGNNNWTLLAERDLLALSGSPITDFRLGGGYGAQSLDDTRWIGNYKRANGWHGVMSIEIDPVAMTCSVVAMRDLILDATADVSARIGSVHVSPSGDYVYVSARGPGTLYNWDDLTTIKAITSSDRHHDVGRLADGTDVLGMVGRNSDGTSGGSAIGYYVMATGEYVQVTAGPFSGGHISGRNVLVPGEMIVSSYNAGTFVGAGTVFALNLDTGQVRYYLHTHSQSSGNYDAETQACPSPDMGVIAAVCAWDGGQIDCIVAGMDVIP